MCTSPFAVADTDDACEQADRALALEASRLAGACASESSSASAVADASGFLPPLAHPACFIAAQAAACRDALIEFAPELNR